MDIVTNIPKENDNQIQTNQLLVEHFKHFNIEIYGTHNKPLFKAKEIGDLLGFKNVREIIKNYNIKQRCDVSLTDAIGREQNTTFLTEQGLYKILMRSRKPIAEEFQDWVCDIIEQIRQNRIKELEFYKEPSYKELPLEETVYCHSTDIENVFKVGKSTKINSKTRKEQSQTPCVKDIKILHEVKTTDCDLLEKLVHYALIHYRIGKREHFSDCGLEHIKLVMNKCAKFVNTVGGVRRNITEKEFEEKLGIKIVTDKIVEKEQIVRKVVYKTKYNDTNLSDFDLDELLSIDEPKILIQELN